MTRRLWDLSLKFRARTALVAVGFMTLVAAANFGQAWLVRWIGQLIESPADGAAPERAAGLLLGSAILVILAGGWKGGALYAQMVVTQRLAFRVIQDLQNAMFATLTRADLARTAGEAPGALAARFTSDVERVREGIARSASNLGRDALTVLAMLVFMVIVDWQLTLLVVLVYPLVFGPVLAVGRRVRAASTRAQEQMGALGAFLTEAFAGARLVKTYGLEDRQIAKAEDAFEARFALNAKIARGRALAEPLLEIVGAIAFAGIVAFAAWRLSTGGFSISTILAFVAALAILAPAARAIGTLAPVLQEGFAALDRVFAVLDEPARVVDAPDATPLAPGPGAIGFSDVRVQYPSGALALDGASFTASGGQVTALVGPSGGGKTTLLNLVPRLFDPTGGAVMIDGRDVRGLTLASLRGAVAVVSQDAVIFADTVRANLAFAKPGASDAELLAALDAAAARDFVEALPGGLDAVLAPDAATLSGGQRQRLALARAILKDAPILLLDEATSALDADAEAHVQAALERLQKGRTTLVVAHRLATVLRADKIVVIADGKVVEEGTDADLKDRAGGLYARLRARQFEAG